MPSKYCLRTVDCNYYKAFEYSEFVRQEDQAEKEVKRWSWF
jgi:hypothetical protein